MSNNFTNTMPKWPATRFGSVALTSPTGISAMTLNAVRAVHHANRPLCISLFIYSYGCRPATFVSMSALVQNSRTQ
jgi:hypothetical protein